MLLLPSAFNYCLNPCFSGGWSRSGKIKYGITQRQPCLNPCFSGGWSRRVTLFCPMPGVCNVLILVLVEDGLGVHSKLKFPPPTNWS